MIKEKKVSIPELRKEHIEVIEWVEKLREGDILLPEIIECLIDSKGEPWGIIEEDKELIEEGLEKVREIYRKSNPYYKGNLLKAIVIGGYNERSSDNKTK